MLVKPRDIPFRHETIEAPPRLERIDGGEFRLYRTANGEEYPSVTSVLSVLPHGDLDAWKMRVGAEEAARISSQATTRGTAVHALAEAYLKNETFDTSPFFVSDFMPLKRVLDERVNDVVALELPLYSERLRIAGTTDCIAKFDGVRSLIDFKTSKHRKSEDEILSYFLQTAAYAMMTYERTGIVLKDIVILMTIDGGECMIFKKKVADYMGSFLNIRKQFKELHLL